jgi:cell division protein FtsN
VPLIANRPLPKSHPRNRPTGATPRSKRIVAVPGWLWLIAGVAGGVLIMSLVNLASSSAPAGNTAPATKPVEPIETPVKPIDKPAEKTVDETTPAKPATKFDFYTLLPEQEVIEPNERPASSAPAAKADGARKPQQPATAAQTAQGEEFILQAGSFRSATEADKRRAQVQALGLPSRRESVSAGGDTWYRVLVGPFPSRDAVTQARDKLAAQNIDTIIVRKKTAR